VKPEYGKDYLDTHAAWEATWGRLRLAVQEPCLAPVADCPGCQRVGELYDTLDRLCEALAREAP
jgi:hypothetical protein